MYRINTTERFYTYEDQRITSNVQFLVYVKAVKGAGANDPSNNVSVSSLPDIGPWKYDREIRVNVSIEVRYCHLFHSYFSAHIVTVS